MMRLFIGVQTTDAVKDALWEAVSALHLEGRITHRENYHLTLAFLGMREEARLPQIETIVAETAKTHPPLTLTVRGMGFFGKRENALLYAAVKPCEPLLAVDQTLRMKLTEMGETFDPKLMVPHITLARKADVTKIDLERSMPQVSFAAEKLTLFHSTRINGTLTYLPIYEADL